MESVDLTFLSNFTKGDRIKTERYIKMYLKHSKELIDLMKEALTNKDAKNLAIHAHSLKPQAEMIGVLDLKENLALLEDRSRNNDLETIPLLLAQIEKLNSRAEFELNAFLENEF